MIRAAGQRDLMPRIAREEDRLHMRVALAHFAQNLAAAVTGTVVDKEDLVRIGQRFHHLFHALHKVRNIVLLVVDRNHNRNTLHHFTP